MNIKTPGMQVGLGMTFCNERTLEFLWSQPLAMDEAKEHMEEMRAFLPECTEHRWPGYICIFPAEFEPAVKANKHYLSNNIHLKIRL